MLASPTSPDLSSISVATAVVALSSQAQSAASAATALSERIFGTSRGATAIVSLRATSTAPDPVPTSGEDARPLSSPSAPSSSAAPSTTATTGIRGNSASDLFGSIGKSPASIGLTTIIALAVLAVLLGLAAFAFRRKRRRRRVPLSNLDGTPPSEWEFPGRRQEGDLLEHPDSDVDSPPAATWVPQRHRPRQQMVEVPRVAPESSEWTSFAGDGHWTDSDDSHDAYEAGIHTAFYRQRQPSHPLRESFVAESPESEYSDPNLQPLPSSSPETQSLTSFAAYQRMSAEERGRTQRPQESWRSSLDRVLTVAASLSGGRHPAPRIGDDERYTSFHACAQGSRRAAPPPPIGVGRAQSHGPPPAATPRSSTYSSHFAFSPPPTTPSAFRAHEISPSEEGATPDDTSLTFGPQHAPLHHSILSTSSPASFGALQTPILPTRSAQRDSRTSGQQRRPSDATSTWGSVEDNDGSDPPARPAPAHFRRASHFSNFSTDSRSADPSASDRTLSDEIVSEHAGWRSWTGTRRSEHSPIQDRLAVPPQHRLRRAISGPRPMPAFPTVDGSTEDWITIEGDERGTEVADSDVASISSRQVREWDSSQDLRTQSEQQHLSVLMGERRRRSEGEVVARR